MVSCCRVYVDTVIVDLKGWAKDFISTPIEDLWIRVRAETKKREPPCSRRSRINNCPAMFAIAVWVGTGLEQVGEGVGDESGVTGLGIITSEPLWNHPSTSTASP